MRLPTRDTLFVSHGLATTHREYRRTSMRHSRRVALGVATHPVCRTGGLRHQYRAASGILNAQCDTENSQN